MYVKPFIIDNECFLGASTSDGRILWASYSKRRLISVIELPEPVDDGFDVSPDGRYIVTVYWYTKGAHLWDLQSGTKAQTFGGKELTRALFDSTGAFAVIGSDRGRLIRDISEETDLKLSRCGDICGACSSRQTNTMLLPSTRNGYVIQFDGRTRSTKALRITGHTEIWLIRWSPEEDKLLMMDDTGLITCRASLNAQPDWELRLQGDDITSLGDFSPDGKFVAFSANEAQQTIVIDANDGRVLSRLPVLTGATWRYVGSKVMSSGGKIIDLADGSVNEELCNWRWWRSIGV